MTPMSRSEHETLQLTNLCNSHICNELRLKKLLSLEVNTPSVRTIGCQAGVFWVMPKVVDPKLSLSQ